LLAFATEMTGADGGKTHMHLHTSPEFAMKKLLVAGEPRIFQMARVFRDGERADTHHPEFIMLEWYRAGADYTALMDDCAELLKAALAAANQPAFCWQERRSDPNLPWQRITVAAAFERYAGIDLAATSDDAAALGAEAARLGLRTDASDDWEDAFFRIFLNRIEPHLGSPAPTILYEYPIRMAALSRPKPGDASVAERFELYVAGLELANAFSELNDAVVQRQRFADWGEESTARYGRAYPIDEDFLAALAHGMPAAAGIALGFDRLVMLATGAKRIDDVLWAPVAERGS
jgi:lysyl-tRNA synthetase class 2